MNKTNVPTALNFAQNDVLKSDNITQIQSKIVLYFILRLCFLRTNNNLIVHINFIVLEAKLKLSSQMT